MRFAFFICCASLGFGQTTATITGTVSNLPGEAVANIPVQAVNSSTSALYKGVSSKNGVYTLPQLPSGTYEISVAVQGFNPFSQKNVTIAAAQTLHLDIHLMDYQLDTLGDGREFRVDLTSPHATPPGPTPRTAGGKPDFSGVWYAQRPVDPGKPEPLPWVEALLRERAANNSKDDPERTASPAASPQPALCSPYKLIQTPTLLVMLFEDDIPSHRQVFLDGRKHPADPNPSWMGHSIGRWEGDVLVIDTVGFNATRS